MTGSEYLADMIKRFLFNETYHLELVEVGTDLDNETAHAVVRVLTNECAVLIEALQRLSRIGATLTGMHRLRGEFAGCIEVDCQLMTRKTRHAKRPSKDGPVQLEIK